MTHPMLPLDDLRSVSHAYAEFSRQEAKLAQGSAADRIIAGATDSDAGLPPFDLNAIWRAALEDPFHDSMIESIRHFSPARFTESGLGSVGLRENVNAGHDPRIQIARDVAFEYVQYVDWRVMLAAGKDVMDRWDASIEKDWIGQFVEVAKGGLLVLNVNYCYARWHSGMTSEEFAAAVIDRGRQMAEGLESPAAESLMARIRKTLESEAVE